MPGDSSCVDVVEAQFETSSYQFLLSCLRSRWDDYAIDIWRAEHRGSEIDWLAIVERASAEAVAPLVHAQLQSCQFVPPEILENLHALAMISAFRSAGQYSELRELLQLFVANGIQVMALKGAALAETLYGNFVLRPMGDIDLLVREHDAEAACALLLTRGYREFEFSPDPAWGIAYKNNVPLIKRGPTNQLVELHWSLFNSSYYRQTLHMEWFWDTAVTVTLAGDRVLVMAPEAQLLHLCVHLALHHRGRGLLWYHDIAELLVRYESQIDWDIVMEKASSLDLILSLQMILPVVEKYWRAPVPTRILDELSIEVPSQQEVQAHDLRNDRLPQVEEQYWTDLKKMTWRQRTVYARQAIFPSTAYLQYRYRIKNKRWIPLYYPFRWWLAVRHLVRAGSQRLGRRKSPVDA